MKRPPPSLLRRLGNARWRRLHLLTHIHRIHHPRWSFGWSFPGTTWCYFEASTYKDHDQEPPRWTTRPGRWERCLRILYHDSTATGTY